ncbi:MAG: cupin domain-containing protein [Rhizomicrobium sp.]
MSQTASIGVADGAVRREDMDAASIKPLWESPTAHRPPPKPRAAHLWKWEELRRFARYAATLTSPAAVERRVLQLMNPQPASPTDESTVGNLAAALQILLPDEAARPHRHSINALRFVLEGDGVTTIVDGQAVPMHVNDMLLTPGNCWHEHRHTGDKPMIWLDALDVPLHAGLGTITFQPGPVDNVPAMLPQGAFASPGVLPAEGGPAVPYSPVFRYPYKDAVSALEQVSVGPDGTRTVRYVNPLTGGAPMPTIDCRLVGLEPGRRTKRYCSNASAIFLVVEGEGESWANDVHFRWQARDIFIMPPGNWLQHLAQTRARLFVVSDREALSRLGILKEEYRN